MWLIVGLGNPGSKYEKTRHNAGFLVVDQIVEPLSVTMAKSAYGGVVATSELFGQKILFLKPMTYMNKSGTAVMQACRFYKIPPENIIVLHDDIDVPFGKVKAKESGGHGGNNGIRSIIECLGGHGFWRIKLGVGRPPAEVRMDVSSWVLAKLSDPELEVLTSEMTPATLDRIHNIFQQGK